MKLSADTIRQLEVRMESCSEEKPHEVLRALHADAAELSAHMNYWTLRMAGEDDVVEAALDVAARALRLIQLVE